MDAPMHASQRTTRSFADELRELLRLGGPIACTQLGMTAMGFVDCAFLGHYRQQALPAMSLGNTLTMTVLVCGMGVVNAVDPLLSQAVGARDGEAVTGHLLRGALLALLLTIPALALLWPTPLWLRLLDQKPGLIPDAALYAHISMLGIVPFFGFALLRTFLSAHSRVRAQVVAIVAGNLLNALLDWIWIFGRLGSGEHGIAGAAWATVVGRWFMFALLLWLGRADLAPHLRRLGDAAVRTALRQVSPLLRLLRLGLPIGGQYLLEYGVFALSLLLIGQFDRAAGDTGGEAGGPRLGGHQIALQLASMSFMVPLGIGMAAAVRVGWAVGRGDARAARRTALAALCTGACVMAVFMLLFLLLPAQLAAVLTDDSAIASWAAALIPIAGVFQIGDGLQVTAIGCLRGVGDVRSPFLANIAGFWAFGLPLGYWLAAHRGLGPRGLWWGLTAGLFTVACVLLVMVALRFREGVRRLDAG
jgi:MATE family multidrug resistance protein